MTLQDIAGLRGVIRPGELAGLAAPSGPAAHAQLLQNTHMHAAEEVGKGKATNLGRLYACFLGERTPSATVVGAGRFSFVQ